MDLSIVLSILLGFVVSAVAGRLLIPALRRLKAGQAIKEIGPTWHMTKQGTPTMGGLMFIIAIAAVLVVIGWKDLTAGRLGGLYTYLFALVFGAIGLFGRLYEGEEKGEHRTDGRPQVSPSAGGRHCVYHSAAQ